MQKVLSEHATKSIIMLECQEEGDQLTKQRKPEVVPGFS